MPKRRLWVSKRTEAEGCSSQCLFWVSENCLLMCKLDWCRIMPDVGAVMVTVSGHVDRPTNREPFEGLASCSWCAGFSADCPL